MTDFSRYAIYHSPPPGSLALMAARWLGWDAEGAVEMPHPEVPGLPRPASDLTAVPRKYGFHATLRAPFRLADGLSEADLRIALERLAASRRPVRLAGLQVAALGQFLALQPVGSSAALSELARAVVEGSNGWRAPLSEAERRKRNPDRLSDRQRDLLDAWGYPYVFDEFRFHMTLTGPLEEAELHPVAAALRGYFGPALGSSHDIDSLCLSGERPDGRFQIIARYALSG